jgi:hypothetical protein
MQAGGEDIHDDLVFVAGDGVGEVEVPRQGVKRGDDGRAVDVCLTGAGMELADVGAGLVTRSLAPMTSRLTTAETRRLAALLARAFEI